MKKYILIKEYPGSVKLGCTNEYIIYDCSKYPEFWEEVIENDYEILEIQGKYGSISSYKKQYDSDLKDKSIYKIKRLSDGEIFTIGDKVIGDYTNNKYNINSFVINKRFDKIIINGEDIHLNECEKEKLLFTTEDGIDIFEGDVFTTLNKNLLEPPVTYTANLEHKKYDKYLDFSTKEKAEEYLFMNKSCLSYKEASDIMLHRDISAHYKKIIREKLKELVKQKLNK